MKNEESSNTIDILDRQDQLNCKLEYFLMSTVEYLSDIGESAGDLGSEISGFHFTANDIIKEFKNNSKLMLNALHKPTDYDEVKYVPIQQT